MTKYIGIETGTMCQSPDPMYEPAVFLDNGEIFANMELLIKYSLGRMCFMQPKHVECGNYHYEGVCIPVELSCKHCDGLKNHSHSFGAEPLPVYQTRSLNDLLPFL